MKKFNYRAFISITMAFTFVVLAVTGLILYVVPAGRVANWSNWTLLGLSKDQWAAIHTIFSYVFIGFALFHILKYNLKPLLNYIKKKVQENASKRKELAVSSVIIVAFLGGTIAGIPPFSTVMNIGEFFKEAWVENQDTAPVAHAELLDLKELGMTIEMEPDKIYTKLKDAGLDVKDVSQTLDSIAYNNKMSPKNVYAVIVAGENVKEEDHEPGLGKKTLKEVCASLGLSVEKGMEILKNNGIEAQGKDTMREIAARANKTPADIKGILENGK